MIAVTRGIAAGGFAVLLLALTPARPADAKGFRISEKGPPGGTVQIYLTTTLAGKHIQLKQQNGKPWDLTIGKNGTGVMDFGGNVDVQDPNGNNFTLPSSAITDFDQYTQGVYSNSGTVTPFAPPLPLPQINPDASAALQGAYLGTGPTFTLTPLTNSLPAGPGYIPMPDFLSDLNNDGTITAAENIYVGVNMSEWEPVAQSLPTGTTVTVVNGVSSDLPGYYFSLGPIKFDVALGWTSDDPMSGEAVAVAEHDLSSTPEPSALGAMGVGLLTLLSFGWRKRRDVDQ